jgi:orotidine-5'-phosphate decarboxylase
MSKIILSLDGMEENMRSESFTSILRKLTPEMIWGFKVNDALIKYGVSIFTHLKQYGCNVMADPKLYDIPNTMNNCVYNLISAGADIITVHGIANFTPSIPAWSRHLAGITVLTSINHMDFIKYCKGDIPNTVDLLTQDMERKKYGYVVCSALEANWLNKYDIKKICPGIRPSWYKNKDDQKRTVTPKEAVANGADLLVIGRPIMSHKNIIDAIKMTNDEIFN